MAASEKGDAVSKQSDKERQLVLARLGRETIIKNGTYDVDDVRHIDPDHPERNEEERLAEIARREAQATEAEEPAVPEGPVVPDEPLSEEDASALAEQILASNFKVGMSQSEVDSFMSGME